MMPFSLEKARDEHGAVQAAGLTGRYVAGGTTLVDLMREEVEQPQRLIDINALPLKYIRVDGQTMVIGALARMAEVAANPDVKRLQPLLSETLIEGASPQLRNMASIGGNLMQRVRCPYFRMLDAACNKRAPGTGCSAIGGQNGGHAIFGTSAHCVATHPSDLAVSLVALGATMRVLGPSGYRRFPVEDLFRLPGTTPHLEHSLQPSELIVDIHVPPGAYARRARYLKVRDRSSYEFALVSVAAALHVKDGLIQEARIAVGGVGTKPWRMRRSEAILIGHPPGRAAFHTAAVAATEGAHPLSDNAFKIKLLALSVVRALEMTEEMA